MLTVRDLSKMNRNEPANNIHELTKINLTMTKISSFSHQLGEIKELILSSKLRLSPLMFRFRSVYTEMLFFFFF